MDDNRNFLGISSVQMSNTDHFERIGQKKMIILTNNQARSHPLTNELAVSATRRNFLTCTALLPIFRNQNAQYTYLRNTFLEIVTLDNLLQTMAEKTTACQEGIHPIFITSAIIEDDIALNKMTMNEAREELSHLLYETYVETPSGFYLKKENIDPILEYFFRSKRFAMLQETRYPFYLDTWATDLQYIPKLPENSYQIMETEDDEEDNHSLENIF